jgi:hypothetical protein
MHPPHMRLLTAALAAATGITALLASPASAIGRQPAVRTSAPAPEVLLNGDQVIPAGPHGYAVIQAGSGFSADTMSLRLGGRSYLIPDAAFAYLGHGLDPSLFDAAKLPRTGRLPVTITYGGAKAPALPGVTITGSQAGTASGYLTTTSARTFGAALMRQYARDHATGAYGTDGLFANGTTIRLAGSPASPPRPRPMFPMHTLTMKGTTLAGAPDTGDTVAVFNTDDLGRFGDIHSFEQNFYHGEAKFSVPSGHYMAFALYATFGPAGTPAGPQHLVINPGFTVAADASVTLAERTASSKVTISTPRPAAQGVFEWTLNLNDAAGNTFSYSLTDTGPKAPLYLNATTRHPLSGSLRVVIDDHMTSPATARSPYTYDLSFAGAPDVIASHFTAASLATVAARYYADVPQSGYISRYPQYAFTLAYPFFVPAIPVSAPLSRTEYMTAGVYWVTGQYMADRMTGGGGDYDANRTYFAGEKIAENWNGYPLHPTLATSVLGSRDISSTYLSATRTGDTLMFGIVPFGDNTPGHTGEGYWPGDLVTPPGGISGRYELDQNGVKIAAGNADRSPQGYSAFAGQFKVTAAPATFRLTLTADRADKPYVLSTRTSTVWTWRSVHESGNRLPSGWICQNNTTDCTSQPLMTLDYDVASLGANGVAPAGAQVIKVSVGHQQLSAGSATRNMTAQFSVDGGSTWQPATVKGSEVSFSAPAGTKVSLRVSATDSSGSAITETIDNAYAISTSAASAGYRAADCAQPVTGHVNCYLVYSPQTAAVRGAAAGFGPAARLGAPVGWGAADIEKAYKLPVSHVGGTVAVVEMFDTPKLASYLNAYRKQYGLPPCTTANGCFRKVNEYGQPTPLPPNGTNTNWDLEATLDVDMVSAACPKCHILVVEAKPVSWADFANAENTAARLGAVAISNSYGTRESGQVQTYADAYHHPGHAIVVASGDYGFIAASFPANLATVTAAGGTELSTAHNGRGYSERVWNDPSGASGSGCSAYVAKPAWQHDNHCPDRTVTDVSAVATNIAVYEPTYGGWLLVGGTSAASPLIAGVYALAGNATTVSPGYEYAHPGAFFDVTAGNNAWASGSSSAACGGDYLCVAKPGYDAPTGLGTPNSTTAF